MVLLLLINCIFLLSLFTGFLLFDTCFVMQYLVSFSSFAIIFTEEERACCFILVVFLLSCGGLCSVPLLVVSCVGLYCIRLHFLVKSASFS